MQSVRSSPAEAARDVGAGTSAGNPFLEGWAQEAALRHLPHGAGPVGCAGAASGGAGIPLIRRLNVPVVPGSVWSVWDHIHCFDTTPACEADPEALLDETFGFLRRRGASLLYWQDLPTDTPFHARLVRYLADAGLRFEVTRSRVRPFLNARSGSGFDAGAARLEGKHMAEFRRRRRRLEETGRLDMVVHRDSHDAGIWMQDFLRLEASGWKKEAGTAIACNDGERGFFEALMRGASARGQATVYSLELDGRPIAMTINLRSGEGEWSFKTAYCDSLSRYSPGALVNCEMTLGVLGDPSVAWVDSCMEYDGGILGKLWHDRREMVDLMISTGRAGNALPRLARAALTTLRGVKTRMRPPKEAH